MGEGKVIGEDEGCVWYDGLVDDDEKISRMIDNFLGKVQVLDVGGDGGDGKDGACIVYMSYC